jgi:Fanconi anemia group M protein
VSEFIEHPLIKPKKIQSRIYQQVLYAESMKSNTLIILPTGMGKTIVMVMVAANFLSKDTKKQVVIIAPTRPLVDQHSTTLKDKLNINPDLITIISGHTPPQKRKDLWDAAQVLIATPQTIRNDIVSGICELSRISLLCVDEAHRAVGDDPYVLPVQQYLRQNPKGRIIGFTASPGNKEKLKEVVHNIGITNIQYMDETSPQVKPYTHQIDENWIHIELPPEFVTISNLLKSYMQEHLKLLKQIGVIKSSQIVKNSKKDLVKLPAQLNSSRDELGETDFFSGMRSYGQLMLVSQGLEMLETQGLVTAKAFFDAKIDEVERSNKSSLKYFLSQSVIKEAIIEVDALVANRFIHPKLTKLKEIITQELSRGEDSRILVFTNYKATTNYLVAELNPLNGIRAHRFVGQSNQRYGSGLKQKEQITVMQQFRSGEYNLLVSTRVGEEGLDVAQCDLVVFYDVTPSATRLIQRSGRTGRARRGKVMMFITKGTRDEGYFYTAQSKKKKIKRAVTEVTKELQTRKNSSTASSRDATSSSDEKKGLELFLDEEVESEQIDHASIDDLHVQDDTQIEEIMDSSKLSFSKNESKPLVYIDHREKGSQLLQELLNSDIKLKQVSLPIGDFVVSNLIGIERKTVSDFCKTLIRNELFDQLIQLKNTYTRPVLIIEGEHTFDCSLNPAAIRGALVSILIDYTIPIIRTVNAAETASMIHTLAKREQRDKSGKPQIRRPTAGSMLEEQLHLLSSLPNIDRILAERLLTALNTPREVFSAHPDHLRKIQGIGQRKADRIDILLSTPFDEVKEELDDD